MVRELAAAIEVLVEEGEKIGEENEEMREFIIAATEDVKVSGRKMETVSDTFAHDPADHAKREVTFINLIE